MKFILAVLVCCRFSLLLAADLPSTPTKPSIVAATYNIRCPIDAPPNDWPARASRVAQVIRNRGFEIIGMQEGNKDQIADLSARLPGFAWVGVGRDDGKTRGEFNCIFYLADRFELLKSETFWLSETPEKPGSRSWNSACARVCTYGLFRDRKTGTTLVFANTHLDHRSPEARINGAKLIVERLLASYPDLPIVLTGDFNCTPGSAPLLALDGKFYNTLTISRTPHAGPDSTFSAFVVDPAKRKTGFEIDYIFVSRGVTVLSHTTCDDLVDNLCPSDHFPVTAKIVLP